MGYADEVIEFGRPSEQQMRAYANHLSGAHSWYKHLPVDEPGEAFFVFPSPHTQTAWISNDQGTTRPRSFVRELDARGFRHIRISYEPGDVEPNSLPPLDYVTGGVTTDEYRERFGIMSYWNYSRPGEPRDEALDKAAQSIKYRDSTGTDFLVPHDVLEAGLVYLTAAVDPMFELRDEVAHGRSRREQLDELVEAQGAITTMIFGS